jgi:sporulation and cell division protein SsgA
VIRTAPDGTLSFWMNAQVLVEGMLVDHPLELSYSARDALAICLRFPRTGNGDPAGRHEDVLSDRSACWRLDRNVLRSGHATGELCGDVRVTRLESLGLVVVELLPGSVVATTVRVPSVPVDEFLEATYRKVPAGSETMDVDGLIRRLLARD